MRPDLRLAGADDKYRRYLGLSNELRRLKRNGDMESVPYSIAYALERAADAIDELAVQAMKKDGVPARPAPVQKKDGSGWFFFKRDRKRRKKG